MKIYHEPKVWLVTQTQLVICPELPSGVDTLAEIDQYIPGFARWYSAAYHTASHSELAIEMGGRNCYHSWHNPGGKTNEEYIDNIIKHAHYSVLEHASAGFLVFANREITHELVRHRHQSFSQESTRYVSYGEGEGKKEPVFVVPEMFFTTPEDRATVEEYLRSVVRMYEWAHERAAERYEKIQDRTMRRKLARQSARGALPHWLGATIMISGNFRAWFEALPKRLSYHADIGIRLVYLQILEHLENLAPAVFSGRFERKVYEDGTPYAELIN